MRGWREKSKRGKTIFGIWEKEVQKFLAYFCHLVAQMVKNLPAMWKTLVRSLGQEDPLEKKLATHSSILAWRIPWTEEPGGLYIVHGGVKSQTQLSTRSHTDSQMLCKWCPAICILTSPPDSEAGSDFENHYHRLWRGLNWLNNIWNI